MARRYTSPHDNANPWGLTLREVEVLRAVVATGSQKGAARDLCIGLKTIERHVRAARKVIDTTGVVRHLICFDRWDRQINPSPP